MLAGAARGARRSGPRGPRRGEGPRGRGSEGAGARPFPAPRGPRSPFPKSSYSFGVPSAALRARVPGRNGRAGRQRASRCGGRGGESHTPAPPGAQARAHTSHVEHTLRRTERRVGHARGRPLETAAAYGEHHAGTAPRAARAEPSEDPAAPRPARVRGGALVSARSPLQASRTEPLELAPRSPGVPPRPTAREDPAAQSCQQRVAVAAPSPPRPRLPGPAREAVARNQPRTALPASPLQPRKSWCVWLGGAGRHSDSCRHKSLCSPGSPQRGPVAPGS